MANPFPSATVPAAKAIIARLSQESDVITGLDIGPGTVFARLLQYSGQRFIAIATDPAVDRGAIGIAEAAQCLSALSIARQQGLPVIWLLDTSGIRVTEGVRGIVALRHLVQWVTDLRLDGTRMLAVGLGSVFGGMSMVAALSGTCIVHERTLIAVSGPRLIGAADPSGKFDAYNAVHVQGLIGGPARARLSQRVHQVQADDAAIVAAIKDWLNEPPQTLCIAELTHAEEALAARLPRSIELAEVGGCASLDTESDHLQSPESAPSNSHLVLTLRSSQGATAADCLRIARALRVATTKDLRPRSIAIMLDAPGHSAAPNDEELHLGEFLAHVALAVAMAVRAGIPVDVVVAGDGGGAIQGALGGPATSVAMKSGALLHVLSPEALAALRTRTPPPPCSLTEALLSGAADFQCPQSERPHVGR